MNMIAWEKVERCEIAASKNKLKRTFYIENGSTIVNFWSAAGNPGLSEYFGFTIEKTESTFSLLSPPKPNHLK